MKKYILISFIVLLSSCGASIKTNITSSNTALTIENKVALLDLHHNVPEGAKKIGESKFGDTGFSIDCGFNSNLVNARKIARKNGANIVKVSQKKTPDLWSTCYRMVVEYYYYEGNVADLQQYQIQVD